MRKTILSALGVLLIAGAAAQIAPASARYIHRAPAASSETFRNAYDSANGTAHWCSKNPGNPYNPDTDYQGWSAWIFGFKGDPEVLVNMLFSASDFRCFVITVITSSHSPSTPFSIM